jgi:SSS family solute:Na+ symporter
VILGVLVVFWMSLSPRLGDEWAGWRSPFHSFMVIVIGTLTILLVGLLISHGLTGRTGPCRHRHHS